MNCSGTGCCDIGGPAEPADRMGELDMQENAVEASTYERRIH